MPDQLNPLNNEFMKKVAGLFDRMDAVERGVQPYQGDWVTLNISGMSYASDNYIHFNSTGGIYNLQIGDRIQITQTTVKNFYVIGSSNGTYQLDGGTDYKFTNAPFTTFAFSRVFAPSIFPTAFNYTATITKYVDGNYEAISQSFNYSMTGKIVWLRGNFTGYSRTDGFFGINEVVVSLPIGNLPVASKSICYYRYVESGVSLYTGISSLSGVEAYVHVVGADGGHADINLTVSGSLAISYQLQ